MKFRQKWILNIVRNFKRLSNIKLEKTRVSDARKVRWNIPMSWVGRNFILINQYRNRQQIWTTGFQVVAAAVDNQISFFEILGLVTLVAKSLKPSRSFYVKESDSGVIWFDNFAMHKKTVGPWICPCNRDTNPLGETVIRQCALSNQNPLSRSRIVFN